MLHRKIRQQVAVSEKHSDFFFFFGGGGGVGGKPRKIGLVLWP